MAKGGYIKLWRKIDDWEYYGEPLTTSVWIHLLINATTKTILYKGHELKRGQLVVKQTELAKLFGVSIKQIRTVISKLHSNGQIKAVKIWRETLITIVNFDNYQEQKGSERAVKGIVKGHSIEQEERIYKREGLEPSLTEEEIAEGWEE